MAKMSMKKPDKGSLLCLGGSSEALEIIKHVKKLGYRPIIFDNRPDCPAAQWAASFKQPKKYQTKRHEAVFLKADCYSSRSILEIFIFAIRMPRRHNIDGGSYRGDDLRGVLCCGIDAPMVAADLAKHYHLPTLGEAAKWGVNKYEQIKQLDKAGIPIPLTKVINAEMSWSDVQDYDIVKPVDNRGSRGVRWYTNRDYQEAIVEASSHSKLRQVIGQTWLEGHQYSTESVVYNKRVIFTAIAERNYDRMDEFYPYIIEDGSSCPAELNADETRAIVNVIECSCAALEWDNLTVKGDLVIDPLTGTVSVIELAPRLSGGYFASNIIPLAYGWDIVKEAVLIATGQEPLLELNRVSDYICQRFVFPKPEWVGKHVKELPQPIGQDCEKLVWNFAKGDVVRPVKAHPDRLGMVLTTAATSQEATRLANEIVSELTEEIMVE